jgi:GH24 family phage-related lysozyme (muramidase)
MSYLDQSAAQLTIFEGSIAWMYLDSRGFVTVAVGDMLPNATSAQALEFVDNTGQPANPAAILADFQRVAGMSPNLNANAYRTAAALTLPQPAIASLLMGRIQDFDNALSGKFADYSTFPDPAKLGLLDMVFNLGAFKLFNTYPTFMRYVNNTDWAGAALQCNRIGPAPARNAWTVQQFNLAASLQAPQDRTA